MWFDPNLVIIVVAACISLGVAVGLWFEDPNLVIIVVVACITLGVTIGYFIKSLFEILTK